MQARRARILRRVLGGGKDDGRFSVSRVTKTRRSNGPRRRGWRNGGVGRDISLFTMDEHMEWEEKPAADVVGCEE